jgi:hypothetical protein
MRVNTTLKLASSSTNRIRLSIMLLPGRNSRVRFYPTAQCPGWWLLGKLSERESLEEQLASLIQRSAWKGYSRNFRFTAF